MKVNTGLLELLEQNEELMGNCMAAAQRIVPNPKPLPSHVEMALALFGATLRRYVGEPGEPKASDGVGDRSRV